MAWKSMKLDLKSTYKLENLDDLIKDIQTSVESKFQAISNAIDKLTTEALNNNLESTVKLPVETTEKEISGGIETTDPIDTFREFGTGAVGGENPHVAEYLKKVGWIYDVNNHGESGWFYPITSSDDHNPFRHIYNGIEYGWTKGQRAQMKFYNSVETIIKKLPEEIIKSLTE